MLNKQQNLNAGRTESGTARFALPSPNEQISAVRTCSLEKKIDEEI